MFKHEQEKKTAAAREPEDEGYVSPAYSPSTPTPALQDYTPTPSDDEERPEPTKRTLMDRLRAEPLREAPAGKAPQQEEAHAAAKKKRVCVAQLPTPGRALGAHQAPRAPHVLSPLVAQISELREEIERKQALLDHLIAKEQKEREEAENTKWERRACVTCNKRPASFLAPSCGHVLWCDSCVCSRSLDCPLCGAAVSYPKKIFP